MSIAEVAAKYGKAYSSIANLLADPDGSKQRRRRERYRGKCVDCGAKTDGSNGRAKAAKRCKPCAAIHDHAQQYWTRERVIAAIQDWAKKHGSPPIATDWMRAGKDRSHPAFSNVYVNSAAHNAPFMKWADAIEAAGFPRPLVGQRRDRETWLENLTAAHRRRFKFARDYGPVRAIGVEIGVEQHSALSALNGIGISEHVRRALDLYLKHAANSGEDAHPNGERGD